MKKNHYIIGKFFENFNYKNVFYTLMFFFLLYLVNLYNPLFNWSITVLFLILIRFFMGTVLEVPILILSSWFHLIFVLEKIFDSSPINSNFNLTLFAPLFVLFVSFILILINKNPSKKINKWIHPWIFILIFYFGIFTVDDLSKLPSIRVAFLLSYLIWPFLLALNEITETKKINILSGKENQLNSKSLLLTLFPFWFVGFFVNVPTETGPMVFQENLSRSTSHRKSQLLPALTRLLHVIKYILIANLMRWICIGGEFLNIKFLKFNPPWFIYDQIGSANDFWSISFFLSLYYTAFKLYFHFLIITLTANSVALFSGFEFSLNESMRFGIRTAKSWSLLFYYFNYLPKKLFFYPITKYLQTMIKNRKFRTLVSAIISIYAFSFCYFSFIPFSGFFKDQSITNKFQNRLIYLIFVCLVAFFRIYGPKIPTNKKYSRLIELIILMLITPLVTLEIFSFTRF